MHQTCPVVHQICTIPILNIELKNEYTKPVYAHVHQMSHRARHLVKPCNMYVGLVSNPTSNMTLDKGCKCIRARYNSPDMFYCRTGYLEAQRLAMTSSQRLTNSVPSDMSDAMKKYVFVPTSNDSFELRGYKYHPNRPFSQVWELRNIARELRLQSFSSRHLSVQRITQ